MSGLPCSPATVEKRATIGVVRPGWKSDAFVYALTSPVIWRWPKAPDPFACTTRSGTRSRLNCAIFSIR